jgi:hypothetical protein
MKLAALVLILSALAPCEVRAEDAIAQNRLAQMEQPKPGNQLPAGSCMPIGLTARGDIVFPWECRELIEQQRGPISEDIQNPPEDAASKEPASQGAPPEQVVAKLDQSIALPKAAATDDQSESRSDRKKVSRHARRRRDDTASQTDTKFTGAIK